MSMRGLRWSGIGMGNDVIKNRSLTYWFTRFKIGRFAGNAYLCGQDLKIRHKKNRIHHLHLLSGRGTTGTAPQRYKEYGL